MALSRLKLAFLLCFVVISGSLIFSHSAVFANQLPAGTIVGNNGSPGEYEEIVTKSTAITLNAPAAFYTIYTKDVDPATGNPIFDLNLYGCQPPISGSQPVVTAGCDASRNNKVSNAQAILYYANSGSPTDPITTVSLTNGTNNLLSGEIPNINKDAQAPQYYAIKMEIVFNASDSQPTLNGQTNPNYPGTYYNYTDNATELNSLLFAFRLNANGNTIVGYDGLDQNTIGSGSGQNNSTEVPFSMQYRGSTCSGGYDQGTYTAPKPVTNGACSPSPPETSYEINFQSACGTGTSGNENMYWYDADGDDPPNTGSPQNWSVGFDLRDSQGNKTNNFTVTSPNIGGNEETEHSSIFIASANSNQNVDTYHWDWNNVLYNNGVQFSIPTGAIGAMGIDCTPVGPNTTPISGRVYDLQNGNGIGNVKIVDCSNGDNVLATTAADGTYTASIPDNQEFCLATEYGGQTNTIDGSSVHIRPFNSGQDPAHPRANEYTVDCQNYTGSGGNPDYCVDQNYRCQYASQIDEYGVGGTDCTDNSNNDVIQNRGISTGYQFVYDTGSPNVQTTTITGKVYDQATNQGLGGAQIVDCSNDNAYLGTTSAIDGTFSVTINQNQAFCLAVEYNGTLNSVNGNQISIRPYNNGQAGVNNEYTNDCQNFGGPQTPNSCVDENYRCQIAGTATDSFPSGNPDCTDNRNGDQIYNRGLNNGYQFVYTPSTLNGQLALSCDAESGAGTATGTISAGGATDGTVSFRYNGKTLGSVTEKAKNNVYYVNGATLGTSLDGMNPVPVAVLVNGNQAETLQYPSCAAPTCQQPYTVPTSPQPGQAFVITTTVTWSYYGSDGQPNPPPEQTAPPTTSDPGGITINPTPSVIPPTLSGGTYTESETWSALSTRLTEGVYAIYYQDGAGTGCQNNASITIQNEPYLKVYGGDTVAGSSFASTTADSSCSDAAAPATGSIYAWNTASYTGSSTDEGAFARGLVDGLASANGGTAGGGDSSPGAPQSLTFANSNNNDPDSPSYGGNFGDASCVPDFYDALVNTKQYTTTTFAAAKLIGSPNSPTMITGKTVYLSTADMTVQGNIEFNTTTNYAAPKDQPLFYVVVKGANIYIDDNVTEADGVYIAEPTIVDGVTTGGQIFTCANYGDSTALYNNCQPQLKVKGSLIGNVVHFLRTNGTVNNSTTEQNCTSSDPNVSETYCYLPDVWLASPYPASGGNIDAISSLPPVL